MEACLQDFTATGWRTTGYQSIGNTYSVRWCQSRRAQDDCQMAAARLHDRERRVIELGTCFYPAQYPAVFGLVINASWLPEQAGWGAMFYFREGCENIYGRGIVVSFEKYVAGSQEAIETVSLSTRPTYRIFETTISLPEEKASLFEELAAYLESPEAMRDAALKQVRALSVEVQAAILEGRVTACERGQAQGDQGQPPCMPRPLTPEERATEIERAAAHFALQQSLLAENYRELYTVWMKAIPLDQCWPR
jgi:hypothetical protein